MFNATLQRPAPQISKKKFRIDFKNGRKPWIKNSFVRAGIDNDDDKLNKSNPFSKFFTINKQFRMGDKSNDHNKISYFDNNLRINPVVQNILNKIRDPYGNKGLSNNDVKTEYQRGDIVGDASNDLENKDDDELNVKDENYDFEVFDSTMKRIIDTGVKFIVGMYPKESSNEYNHLNPTVGEQFKYDFNGLEQVFKRVIDTATKTVAQLSDNETSNFLKDGYQLSENEVSDFGKSNYIGENLGKCLFCKLNNVQ